MPPCRAIASPVTRLSPVIITTSTPRSCKPVTASGAPCFMVSATASTPAATPPPPARRRHRHPRLLEEGATADEHLEVAEGGAGPTAGDGAEVRDGRDEHRALGGALDDGARNRVLAPDFHRGRSLERLDATEDVGQ